jgi:hypothetical protein
MWVSDKGKYEAKGRRRKHKFKKYRGKCRAIKRT